MFLPLHHTHSTTHEYKSVASLYIVIEGPSAVQYYQDNTSAYSYTMKRVMHDPENINMRQKFGDKSWKEEDEEDPRLTIAWMNCTFRTGKAPPPLHTVRLPVKAMAAFGVGVPKWFDCVSISYIINKFSSTHSTTKTYTLSMIFVHVLDVDLASFVFLLP